MADEILLHYAAAPVTFDPTRTYEQTGWHGQKPHGLWVSVKGEDDWEWWCRDNEFCLDELNVAHRVVLNYRNVLRISTPSMLDEFHLMWSYETEFEREMVLRGEGRYDHTQENGLTFSRNQWPIDWVKVAQQWKGIIITPYMWSRRLGGPFWYYGWDCASGCIWDLSAVKSFELVGPSDQARFSNLEFDGVQELNTPTKKEA